MTYLPLAGIRVLDLSRVLAGPLCTMLLADLGADVIKVERPHRGDDTRSWGPPFDARGESAYYLSVNRNKLSIAADLSDTNDRALITALLEEADVIVENFLPGALGRLGIDRPALMRKSSRLIWCTITGFGPESDRPGYDFVVQAESGWMSITGEAEGEPMKSGVALADITAGKDAVIAILAALVARERSGQGQHVTIALDTSARAALINVAQNVMVSGKDARRWGNAHANLVPYQLFHAKDRPIVIAVGTDAQWRECAKTLGLDALAEDPELAANPGRLAQRDRIVAAFEQVLSKRTAAEWLSVLQPRGVPSGIVKSVLEAISDAGGASAEMGLPSSVGGSTRRPPPRLDEHGNAIRGTKWGVFSSPV